MMNHKQCIAIIALIAVFAGAFMYRHHMMCKSDDVKIQTCWQDEDDNTQCSQPKNGIIAG